MAPIEEENTLERLVAVVRLLGRELTLEEARDSLSVGNYIIRGSHFYRINPERPSEEILVPEAQVRTCLLQYLPTSAFGAVPVDAVPDEDGADVLVDDTDIVGERSLGNAAAPSGTPLETRPEIDQTIISLQPVEVELGLYEEADTLRRQQLRQDLTAKLQSGWDTGDFMSARIAYEQYFSFLEQQHPGLSMPHSGKAGERIKYILEFFAETVQCRGTEVVEHYLNTLDKLLAEPAETPEDKIAAVNVASAFARNVDDMYLPYSLEQVQQYVIQGLQKQGEARLQHFQINRDDEEITETLDDLMEEEHRRLVSQLPECLRAKAENLRLAGEVSREREFREAAEKVRDKRSDLLAEREKQSGILYQQLQQERIQLKRYKFLGVFATVAVVGAVVAYKFMTVEATKYREAAYTRAVQVQSLSKENKDLQHDYSTRNEEARRLREGSAGALWKKEQAAWQGMYDAEMRRANTAEQGEKQFREGYNVAVDRIIELKRTLAGTTAERIKANIRDPKALSRIAAEYTGRLRYVRIPGPGCEKGLKNLHTAMGGYKETESPFVSALEERGVCEGIADDKPFVEFYK